MAIPTEFQRRLHSKPAGHSKRRLQASRGIDALGTGTAFRARHDREAWETLTPDLDDLMVAWPVGTRVDATKNNDAKLIEPV
jgi:hypothetical protein